MMILLQKIKSFFIYLYKFIFNVTKRFIEDSCLQRAAGLTYSTILAIVPLCGVFLAFIDSPYWSQKIQHFLASTLLPTRQDLIMSMINDFLVNSQHLGTFGILTFIVTVVFLLNTIEVHMNWIFRVKLERDFIRKITTYTTVLVFAGLLGGASASLSGSMLNSIVLPHISTIRVAPLFSAKAVSALIIFIGLLLLLFIIPSKQVHLRSALPGALLGTLAWEVAKRLFSLWADSSARMSIIYGSLFLFPLMLLWLFVVWIIVLYCAELTFVHQHRKEIKKNEPLRQSLGLYTLIAKAYLNQQEAPTMDALCKELGITERICEKRLKPLKKERIVLPLQGKRGRIAYIPGISPEQLKVTTLFSILVGINNKAPLNTEDSLTKIILDALDKELQDATIKEFL